MTDADIVRDALRGHPSPNRAYALAALDRLEAERDAALAKMRTAHLAAIDERDRLRAVYTRVEDERDRLRERAERLLYIAEHLAQMVPQDVWREHGAEWMGQYEGDYHAEQVRDELGHHRAALGGHQ